MISIISFVIALVVISTLIYILLKQKAESSAGGQAKRGFVAQEEATNTQSQGLNEGLVQSKWAEITAMQESGPSGLKNALFEADKLLDYCMIGKGFQGETMGERLKSSGGKIANINSVWSAHKLRNQLAHEVEHDVVPAQVKAAIKTLGDAIVGLGIRLS